MRRLLSLFAVLAVLGAPSIALAKKAKPVQAAKIGKIDVDSIDKVFAQVKKIDKKIMASQKKLDANRANLNKTLGLKKSTPVSVSLKTLKKKAGGNNIAVKKDPKTKIPTVSAKANTADNLDASFKAVNQMAKDLKASMIVLKTVPKDSQKLIQKAQKMPAKLKKEFQAGTLPVSLGAIKTLAGNVKATMKLPKKAKQLGDSMKDIMQGIIALGE